VYLTLRDRPASTRSGKARIRQRVANTVILLGVVSLLTDISSESVNAALPNYLLLVVGLSPQAFGFVNGLYNGVSAVIRLLGGWVADRTDHPKWVAFAGYFASALTRVALIPAHSFAAITGVITADRLGKGLRTAPRDALIAASSPPETLGRAFGVHRALDTAGAILGMLMTFWILSILPNDYHTVFVASLAFAVMGVAVLLLIVPDLRPRRQNELPGNRDAPAKPGRVTLRHVANPQMARLLIAAALLGVLTIGDTFLYLQLQDRDNLAIKYFALLMVGANVGYLVLAIPMGRVADRIGRWKVFIGGHIALLLSYLCAGGPLSGPAISISCLALLGAYYAATDGVLAALAGRIVDPAARTSGIATAQTVAAAAQFAASVMFGVMWTQFGRMDAIRLVAGMLALMIPIAALVMRGVGSAADRTVAA
jgi:MFS family permease